MNLPFEVRPFADEREYARMVDYFLTADDEFLRGMGVARNRLPARDEWIASAIRDHHRPVHEKERAYLAWLYDGTLIGHSSLTKIMVGEKAFIHLHIWSPGYRREGLGTDFFRFSAERFARECSLKRLFCEPFADNPSPNRVLPKAGFRFVKRYRTTPGPINFEQDVNQYVRDFTGEHALHHTAAGCDRERPLVNAVARPIE